MHCNTEKAKTAFSANSIKNVSKGVAGTYKAKLSG